MTKASYHWSAIVGTVVAVVGLALSYNLFVGPGARIAGRAFDGLMFFGPAILVAGLLLIWRRQPAADSSEHKHTNFQAIRLVLIGMALIAVPTLLFTRLSGTSSEEATGMLFTMSLFVCGLPGLVLVCVGALRWRARFSLRALFIAITVIALLLGLIIYAARG